LGNVLGFFYVRFLSGKVFSRVMKLILEVGYSSLYEFCNFKFDRSDPNTSEKFKVYRKREDAYPVDAVKNLKNEVRASGADIEVVMYNGFDSLWCGGRPRFGTSMEEVLAE
jgi:hypothetical protein